jgi:hypothetical protein
MPIRLNLLAEAQAAEESRRRDPVKRGIWIGALIAVLMLVWSSSLQLQAILARSELSRIEGQIQSNTNAYKAVLEDQARTADVKRRLDSLRLLSSNRLLMGNLLNALQQTSVDDIQLLRLRLDQLYTQTEGTKTRTNDSGTVIPARPPTSTERIVLTLDGLNSAPNPVVQLNRYKEALSTNPYFREMLLPTNGIMLTRLGRGTAGPSPSAKPSELFTLECRYPEKTR